MPKNTLNFIVDVLLLLAMLTMAGTGLLLYFVLPPGSRGGAGLALWNLDRHEWGDVHFWSAMALLGLLTLHVVLHWDWVCLTVCGWISPESRQQHKPGAARRALYGLVFVTILAGAVAGFLTVGSAGVTRGGSHETQGKARGYRGGRDSPLPTTADGGQADTARQREHAGRAAGDQIRGSMTLAEVADLAGLSVERLRQALGLPEDAPADEQLGRLRQRYGFQMSDVRRIVDEHGDESQTPP